jgi:hypothetical protein
MPLCLLHIALCFVNRGMGWSIRKSTPFVFVNDLYCKFSFFFLPRSTGGERIAPGTMPLNAG